MNPGRLVPIAVGVTAVGLLVIASVAFLVPDDDPLVWVALGDSYSSGHGNLPHEPDAPCTRSAETAYPLLVADDLRADGVDVDLTFAACSGAVASDLADQASVGSDTDLVTMTIGGNDLGFAELVLGCLTTGTTGVFTGADPCRTDDEDQEIRLARAREEIRRALTSLLGRLRDDAVVLLVGYPSPVTDGDACGLFGEDEAAVTWSLAVRLDRLLNRIADDDERVRHVSVLGAFVDHDVCSDEPWFRGIEADFSFDALPTVDRSYHPSEAGVRGYARVLEPVVVACCT